ncbi:MAG: FtsX-like permease family protein [Gammaproteobacteria bacterium]|nr:FtsX-like permease family protein [Gammaproteobacteria bacterium]
MTPKRWRPPAPESDMFSYYARLALISLRNSPALTVLTVGAIALGIGVSLTVLSVYNLMSADPIPQKSDVLYAVTLDSWDPERPYRERDATIPPYEMTFRDAVAVRDSDIPTHAAAMFKAGFSVQPGNPDIRPFRVISRMTDRGLFAMFNLDFIYGDAWGARADEGGEYVVVLNQTTNEKLFGGEDSVGERVRMGDNDFTVVGVVEDWNPTPKYYDVNNGAFDEGEEVFMPFALTEALELYSAGNTNCWKPEDIESYQNFIDSECVWIQYWAQLDDPAQRQNYQQFLDDYARNQQSVGRFQRPLNNRLFPVMEWLEVRQVVESDALIMLAISFMFLAVCVFNTVGLLLARFISRAPHIGIRRALGASRQAIFSQQMVEAALVGTAAGALGIGLAWLGLQGVRVLYREVDRLTYLTPSMIVAGFAIALVAALAAGLYPAWRVCRTSPSFYLRLQ